MLNSPNTYNHDQKDYNPLLQYSSPTSGKRTVEGMIEMRDLSHIPSIIYNEKREEIESIQKNNLSTHSCNESFKVKNLKFCHSILFYS